MKSGHWSDCAVYNGPAFPAGPCDCGGLDLTDDPGHGPVTAAVSAPRSSRFLVEDGQRPSLIEAQEFPANRLVADAASPHLPNPHDGISAISEAAGVDLDVSSVAVVADLKQTSLI
jgi:hypothetical protein